MTRIIILSFTILLGLFSRAALSDPLKVVVAGAENARGQFIVALFDSAENWLKSPRETRFAPISRGGTALAVFDLPPGIYGLAIYHDANADGEINRGFLGIPIEAYGFSNNAVARLGPLGFDAVRFGLPRGGHLIRVRLDRVGKAG